MSVLFIAIIMLVLYIYTPFGSFYNNLSPFGKFLIWTIMFSLIGLLTNFLSFFVKKEDKEKILRDNELKIKEDQLKLKESIYEIINSLSDVEKKLLIKAITGNTTTIFISGRVGNHVHSLKSLNLKGFGSIFSTNSGDCTLIIDQNWWNFIKDYFEENNQTIS